MGGGPSPADQASGTSIMTVKNPNLWGVIDMGSNGIRFSITDLSQPTARVLPRIYAHRNSTSLYEAQYDDDGNQIPIPDEVMKSVIAAFLRFQIFCTDFGVPFDNIRIVATEATRKAINADAFIKQVTEETGLEVEILSQADEGETGAWGVASSASEIRGIVMDLGGGSTQITWMITADGHMKTSPKGAFSFPYGAAALTQRLKLIEKHNSKEAADAARRELREEMKKNFLDAYQGLEVPDELVKEAKREGGFTLYLSGGGFRGWGYLLLYQAQAHRRSYPISIINGFVARKKDFTDVKRLERVARDAERIFRVSDRRRAQVPAVAFLVSVLAEIFPQGIKEARFCQGGVREGVLFQTLKPEIRMESPLEVATAPYAHPLSFKLAELLSNSLPKHAIESKSSRMSEIDDGWDILPSASSMKQVPPSFGKYVLRAMANMLYYHSSMAKELSSAAALYTTSTGILADVQGTSHRNRALLALLLEARYEGDLPPREFAYRQSLRRLLDPPELWWIKYLGAVAFVLSKVYPAGTKGDLKSCEVERESSGGSIPAVRSTAGDGYRFPHKKPHLALNATFADNLGKQENKSGLRLTFVLTMNEKHKDDPMQIQEALETQVKNIIKVGKKKRWIRVSEVDVSEDNFSAARKSMSNVIDYAEDGNDDSDDSDDSDDDDDDDQTDAWGMKVAAEVKVEFVKPGP